jgi:hypothetical protein
MAYLSARFRASAFALAFCCGFAGVAAADNPCADVKPSAGVATLRLTPANPNLRMKAQAAVAAHARGAHVSDVFDVMFPDHALLMRRRTAADVSVPVHQIRRRLAHPDVLAASGVSR